MKISSSFFSAHKHHALVSDSNNEKGEECEKTNQEQCKGWDSKERTFRCLVCLLLCYLNFMKNKCTRIADFSFYLFFPKIVVIATETKSLLKSIPLSSAVFYGNLLSDGIKLLRPSFPHHKLLSHLNNKFEEFQAPPKFDSRKTAVRYTFNCFLWQPNF